MRVSRLINDDWSFGKGLANYVANSAAIRQNVVTRLRSFANDWFLDVTANIDWLNILGNKNNQGIITSEIRRVVLETEGVLTITAFELIEVTERNALIQLSITTIFDELVTITIGIPE